MEGEPWGTGRKSRVRNLKLKRVEKRMKKMSLRGQKRNGGKQTWLKLEHVPFIKSILALVYLECATL